MAWSLIAVLAGSYALGCIVFAYYITRFRHGVDIRKSGSGNAGATNVARLYGRTEAAITLLLDGLKGIAAVAAGFYFVGPDWAAMLALAAAIIGHIWPVQLQFHGGKGVATGLGGFVALNLLATVSVIGIGLVIYAITRKYFRSGLIAISLAGPILWLFGHSLAAVILAAAASALVLIVQHPTIDAPRQPTKKSATSD
jgi:glycerol-3-phosphate acyltransferase PlsY